MALILVGHARRGKSLAAPSTAFAPAIADAARAGCWHARMRALALARSTHENPAAATPA
jgi:hypothetical protein